MLLLALAAAAAGPQPGALKTFTDWTVGCDNTRTCRAVGYQSDVGHTTHNGPAVVGQGQGRAASNPNQGQICTMVFVVTPHWIIPGLFEVTSEVRTS